MPNLPYMRSDIRKKFEEWHEAIWARLEREYEGQNYFVSDEEAKREWHAFIRRDPEVIAFKIMRDLWAR